MPISPDFRPTGCFAESPEGPGWSNSTITVVGYEYGNLVSYCLQPEQMTPGMAALHRVAVELNKSLLMEARFALKNIRG